jgi:hypothetical protein
MSVVTPKTLVTSDATSTALKVAPKATSPATTKVSPSDPVKPHEKTVSDAITTTSPAQQAGNDSDDEDMCDTLSPLPGTAIKRSASEDATAAEDGPLFASRQFSIDIPNDPEPMVKAYDLVPILEQTHLPRGGVCVETKAVGRIQVRTI